MKNYGGSQLDLMAQLSLYITQEEEHIGDIIAVVQKDTPNNLLLGTDTLLCLGFTLLRKDLDTHAVDLICEEKYVLDKEKPSHQQEVEVVTKPTVTLKHDEPLQQDGNLQQEARGNRVWNLFPLELFACHMLPKSHLAAGRW